MSEGSTKIGRCLATDLALAIRLAVCLGVEFIKRNTDYALRALVYMSGHPSREVFSISEITAAEQIPEEFLRKIFQKLTGAGILVSIRGSRGGYALARPSNQITAREIVEVIQGPIAINRCILGRDACERWDKCRLRESWTGIQETFVKFLDSTTLQELAGQQYGGAAQSSADHGSVTHEGASRDGAP